MPLHDWTDDRGWDSVHPLWINALLFWARERLPAGYRAYLGSAPGLNIGDEPRRPDLGVRAWSARGEGADDWPAPRAEASPGALIEAPQPDFRTVASVHPGSGAALHLFRQKGNSSPRSSWCRRATRIALPPASSTATAP